MANRSLVYLAAVTVFYTLASSATGVFLPNYFLESGLGVNQMILLYAVMFATLGILPILTLKFLPKLFEKLLIAGLILGMLFYFLLGFVKNPVILGFVLGLSYATFWPSFNFLLLSFTNVRRRGFVISLLYFVLPTFASITGIFLGGVFINFFKFNALFLLAIMFMFLALVFSLRIEYVSVEGDFKIPRSRLLLLFGIITIIYGFSDVTFIAYPLFLHKLTGGFLEMGILGSFLSIIFAIVSLIAGRISSAVKHRITFAFFGMAMGSLWLIMLSFVQNVPQLVGVSVFYGFSGAFGLFLFALYGDFFKRKHHATLVVLWEVFLMFGRLANLIPVGIFIGSYNFKGYFLVVGLVSLSAAALFIILKLLHSEGRIKPDAAQR
jgi:MFS family permease